MTSFDELNGNELVPAWVKEVVMIGLSVIAILLYGGILSVAIYRTVNSDLPFITNGMERSVAILSGLIGTVVTAGFARGKRVTTTQMRGLRPVGAEPPPFWARYNLRALAQSKMLGLARTVGLPAVSAPLSSRANDASGAPAANKGSSSLAMWLAIVYFVVYFLVGLGAFGLTVMRESVPDMVSNAAWVWLGTLVSAGYAFFGVDPD